MNIRGCGRRASRVVPNVTLTPTVPFADLAIEEERPIVLRNSQASLWPALKRWGTAGYLARRAPTLLEARTLDVAANVPFGAFVLQAKHHVLDDLLCVLERRWPIVVQVVQRRLQSTLL